MKVRDKLKQIEEVSVAVFESEEVTIGEVYEVNCDIIDDYLKALEIIVNKGVNIGEFKNEIGYDKFDYGSYLRYYRDYGFEILTKEEYDLVSKVVKETMEDE